MNTNQPLWALLLGMMVSLPASSGTNCGPQSVMGRWVPDVFATPASPGQAQFARACAAHDACYGWLGADKAFCDAEFGRHLRLECDWAFPGWIEQPSRMACYGAASVYVASVREFGGAYYFGAQQGAQMRWWLQRQQALAQQAPSPQPLTRGEVHGR